MKIKQKSKDWEPCERQHKPAHRQRVLKRGLCFATKEDAIAAAKAMLPIKEEA